MNKKLSNHILFLFTLLFIFPSLSLANGGDQRVVEGKYLINLSRAPFTPRVGVKTSMLASFVDIQKDKLVAEDIVVNVRIAKLGGVGTDKRQFLYEDKNLKVKGGVLEFAYTFQESGLHEIFFDFSFVSNPQKAYEVPDFLMDIQKPEIPVKYNVFILVVIVSAFIGSIVGWVVGRRIA